MSDSADAPAFCARKCTVTFAIYWGFASLGLLIASLGPALFSLERQTNATADALATVFTLRSLGNTSKALLLLLGGAVKDMMSQFPCYFLCFH